MWASNYWATNYWEADYWGTTAPSTSIGYWRDDYWATNYWATNYWASASVSSSVGQIAATVSLQTPSWYWSRDYWPQNYWAGGYWLYGVNPFHATFEAAAISGGAISASISWTGSLAGSTSQVERFDVSVLFTPTWVITEYPAFAGDVLRTLSDDTSSITGAFTAVGARIGAIGATLAADTANLDGSHVAPANRAGTIGTTLGNGFVSFIGLSAAPGSFVGSIGVTLGDAQADINASQTLSSTSGSIGVTLETYTATWRGYYYPAEWTVGVMASQTTTTAIFQGVTVGDRRVQAIKGRALTAPTTRVATRQGRARVGTRRGRQ